ncbi:hypothetical protein L6452_34875 [Arctium lappa]|uniref:Uncharacterized protein n=1 Tax=Arctium lappa TaxID=4217 RepID=A0ACB8YJY0_ARCLA|nr:hypothetical protein L6452_34875 [Arctium lappa]
MPESTTTPIINPKKANPILVDYSDHKELSIEFSSNDVFDSPERPKVQEITEQMESLIRPPQAEPSTSKPKEKEPILREDIFRYLL